MPRDFENLDPALMGMQIFLIKYEPSPERWLSNCFFFSDLLSLFLYVRKRGRKEKTIRDIFSFEINLPTRGRQAQSFSWVDCFYGLFFVDQSNLQSWGIRGQFHQHFTSSFYSQRFQKRKKDSQVKLLFVLLGS